MLSRAGSAFRRPTMAGASRRPCAAAPLCRTATAQARGLSAAAKDVDSWIEDYRRDGCAVIPGFADLMTTAFMMDSMAALVEGWDPQS